MPQIEPRPTRDLTPHPRNPRTITRARLEHLKRVLAADPEMLEARPIIVQKSTGFIVAGNQRRAAALELLDHGDDRFETLPTYTADLDEDRALEWAIRDNEGFGERDDLRTAELLAELAERGRDLELTGLAADAADTLLGLLRKAADPDAVPAPPANPKSKLGDVYDLGQHRLVCGDALTDQAHTLLDRNPACILADPPYGIGLDTDYARIKGSAKSKVKGRAVGVTYRPIIGDAAPFDASWIVLRYPKALEQFWFGANYYRRTLSDDDLDGSWFVWDKRNEGSDAVIGSAFELIWSRRAHKQDLLRHLWTGFTARNPGIARAHPAEKPIGLLEELLTRHTKRGAVILDPFAGAGSIVIACERTGRKAAMIEIDPAYCDVIRQRYADFTEQPDLAP